VTLDLVFASSLKPGHVVGFFAGLISAIVLVPKRNRTTS
jgi:hypothetical protein